MKIKYTISFLLLFCAFVLSNELSGQSVYSLIPFPKTAYVKTGNFIFNSSTRITTTNSTDSASVHAVYLLKNFINKKFGLNLQIIDISSWNHSDHIIIAGLINSSPLMDTSLATVTPAGESVTVDGGYILDISPQVILIAGLNGEGVINGISTLKQLIQSPGINVLTSSAHVWDYPDYPLRWCFNTQNLRGASAVYYLQKIIDTLSYRKLNGIYHTDFKYDLLDQQPKNYFDSVTKFKNLSWSRNIEIIPGVATIGYSSGYLYRDPNLAEGVPTSAVYVMKNDTARLITDTRVDLPNGGFENVDVSGNFTSWTFYDNKYLTQDKTTFHSGSACAKGTNFDGGNCRFCRSMSCQPYRGYVLSAWIKTQNFSGDMVQLLAIGQNGAVNRTLTFTQLVIPQTTAGWTKIEVTFNTLYNNKVLLYVGAWGAHSGSIWFDDFQVKEIGLTNILRRSGTPLTVKNKNTGIIYSEGVDFNPLVDNLLLTSYGNYGPYHQPPVLIRKAGSNIHNGDSVIISSYHPWTTVSDNQGNGSVMVCVSEDTLYKIVKDQTFRLNNLYHPGSFFMGHDEIRNMNWDKSCIDRKMTPAGLLSDNITKCYDIVKSANPNASVYMWSDMVDSFHNAYKNYYLVNGDLTFDWDSIPDSITIVNWNSGKKDQSLYWFASHGFRQVSAPYFDTKNTDNIRQWRLSQSKVNGIRGMMYTTWANDYTFLTPFSYYAWGAGPAIFHKPIDSNYYFNHDSLDFNTIVFCDPYDKTDSIVYTKLILQSFNGIISKTDTLSLIKTAKNQWGLKIKKITALKIKYSIIAKNMQGLTRQTPFYIIRNTLNTAIEPKNCCKDHLQIFPNPAESQIDIQLFLIKDQNINLELFDYSGKLIASIQKAKLLKGETNIIYNTSLLSKGFYFLRFTSENERQIIYFIKN